MLALDLDGTLISCAQRQSAVLRMALASRGLSTDLDRAWRLKRAGASTCEALIGMGFPEACARRAAQHWADAIESPAWLALDRVLPTVRETVLDMRRRARVHLLTARTRPEWVSVQLDWLGLSELFDGVTVVSPQNAVAEKSAALAGLRALAAFGDSETDARAATAAGIPCFIVATGQRDTAFLHKAGIDPVFETLADAWEGCTTRLLGRALPLRRQSESTDRRIDLQRCAI